MIDWVRWIPCSETLPPEQEEVIVSVHWTDGILACDYIDIGEYANGEWHCDKGSIAGRDKVTAWMLLPEPYNGSENRNGE